MNTRAKKLLADSAQKIFTCSKRLVNASDDMFMSDAWMQSSELRGYEKYTKEQSEQGCVLRDAKQMAADTMYAQWKLRLNDQTTPALTNVVRFLKRA